MDLLLIAAHIDALFSFVARIVGVVLALLFFLNDILQTIYNT